MAEKTVHIDYFAVLKKERGLSTETIVTTADTPAELYRLLAARHNFSLNQSWISVAVNDERSDWDVPVREGDRVVFLPPVSGG